MCLHNTHTYIHIYKHDSCDCSNGRTVEGIDHQTVVQLIRQSGNQVNMVILSVSDDEARRLEPESNTGNSSMDYYERRSVPVTIPTTQKMTDDAGKEYVAFNVYMAGRQVASRRYREFDALSNNVSDHCTVLRVFLFTWFITAQTTIW